MGSSVMEKNNTLILSEMFQNSKVNFKSDKEVNELKTKLMRALREINNLYFRDISIDRDGYIILDVDIEEKRNTFGELGYYSTVISKCLDMSQGQVMEVMVECVMEKFNQELELWNNAKEIYKKKHKNENLTGRSEAYAYVYIYSEELKKEF